MVRGISDERLRSIWHRPNESALTGPTRQLIGHAVIDRTWCLWNGDFFLVIAGDELIAGDYYCIPYKAVIRMFDEAYLVHDAKNAPSR